jgi:hypothetical protein
MESRYFSEVLRAAVAGDPDAVEAILSRYTPLINRQSVVAGKYDEDLAQYIAMRVVEQLPNFDPNKLK